MKKLYNIMIALAASVFVLASCEDSPNPTVEVNNKFTIQSESPQWDGGALNFAAEASSATLHIVHDETSNKWGIKVRLDDAWCSFDMLGDDLIVSVTENNGSATRTTYVDVVIGQEKVRVPISQVNVYRPPHVDEPVILPGTDFDDQGNWTRNDI